MNQALPGLIWAMAKTLYQTNPGFKRYRVNTCRKETLRCQFNASASQFCSKCCPWVAKMVVLMTVLLTGAEKKVANRARVKRRSTRCSISRAHHYQ